MEIQTPRPWYKKKRYLLPIGLLGLISTTAAYGGGASPVPMANTAAVVQTLPDSQPTAKSTVSVSPKPTYNPTTPVTAPALSNDNYYMNVDGNSVHSPAYSNSGSEPVGASAQCRDGTYSFSQHRSGTCSRHGGVSQWY